MHKLNEVKLNEWRQLLIEREQLELSIKDFCKLKKISPSNFYHYQALIKYPEKVVSKEINKVKAKNTKVCAY